MAINLNWLIAAYKQCPNQDKFFNKFFDKLSGTDQLRKQIIAGKSVTEIKASWKKDLDEFMEIREQYLLY